MRALLHLGLGNSSASPPGARLAREEANQTTTDPPRPKYPTVGSSLDRTGALGVRLWEHHFKHTAKSTELLRSPWLDGSAR
ncbi:hypothetical protein EI534_14190 [Pseudomonas frederiksbergensis]|nr:hypothetical protein [Pseudomonas frederiksbergensis]